MSETDRQRLVTLLGHLRKNTDLWLFMQKSEERRIKELRGNTVLSLAEAPDRLLLLLRYRRQVEHSIARKLKSLRGE